jgi:formate-dependent nitrite reductase cytochrome c552 subunit
VVRICSQCHSPRGKAVEPEDPTSVRFQGTTLTWSRCYSESRDTLDCVTCHDPHRNVETSHAHYEAKCLRCHSETHVSPTFRPGARLRRFDITATPQASSCPVNPTSGCISCHMPKVVDAIPHSPFTDHFIRVHDRPLPQRRDKLDPELARQPAKRARD